MKDIFANCAAKKIAGDLNFSVYETPWLTEYILKYSFIKEKWGALNIINFTDAENILKNEALDMKTIMDKQLSAYKAAGGKAVIYYNIFVSQDGLSEDEIKILLSLFKHSIVLQATFIPVVIDLKNKSIAAPNKSDLMKIGVYNILNECMLNIPSYDGFESFEVYMNNAALKNKQGSSRIIIKSKKPVFTYILILINIGIFVMMEYAGGTRNPDVLKSFGIKINSLILAGQYWRLITSAFIHIGFAHIAFNMYGLYNLGSIVERIYGNKKFLFIYFVSAILGSLSSLVFSPVPSAGASGAIFGMFGALLFLGRKIPGLFSTSSGLNILAVLGFNLFYGFITPGIDNYAHIGGLLGGYISASMAGFNNSSEK
ncbi:rhomboid protease GluP [Oxobacter pfennigii]|uniref:Rhomboid protease GluP n=1 Tax=Oxobacter pfennigii TaxID=36849 RepID=A0A0P8W8Y6_9CLOT|nr:rhomboid family intramembrane serine protease [Oxobacter pfennigii]KPU44178.1 rhomboid protease GluP [Oxobacter pfennigii]